MSGPHRAALPARLAMVSIAWALDACVPTEPHAAIGVFVHSKPNPDPLFRPPSVLAQRVSLDGDQDRIRVRALERGLELRALAPRERLFATLDLVETWRALADRAAAEPALRSEAASNAGQLLSALGFHGEARDAFGVAASLATEPRSAAMARLEAAHCARRAGQPAVALEGYQLACHQGLEGRCEAEAHYWAARSERELGALEAAERRLAALAEADVDPVLRVTVYDDLALYAIERDDLEAAAGWLQQARQQLGQRAAARTEFGRRVRRALASMRAIAELSMAIEDRTWSRTSATERSSGESQLRIPGGEED